MPDKSVKIDSAAKRGLVVAVGAVCLAAAFLAAKWGLASSAAVRIAGSNIMSIANSAEIRQDVLQVADLAIGLSPSDPYTHFAAARFLEKNFSFDDIERSLAEYETAAALMPHNYEMWLELGRARERSGDAEGAELALRKALELAPNYSRVQWALGNALLRQGRSDEGFAEIRRAVASDPTFTNPAANTAWQIFDGDMTEVRAAIGDSVRLNAAIATLLAGQNRPDEAADIWARIPKEEKFANLNAAGVQLMSQFIEAKKYRAASRVALDLSGNGEPVVGQVSNGSFEGEVKMQKAGHFEWRLGRGTQPQIAPTTGQKYSGNNSLVLIFNALESKEFRPLLQIVAVEPGKAYEFEMFYRSELKTSVIFKWEIVAANDGKVIASTEPLSNTAEWTGLRVKFAVPESTDGVIVRFARENCSGPVCPVNGNLWFDEMNLRLAQ